MASNEWWTDDDPAVFGPVVVEVKVGEIPRALLSPEVCGARARRTSCARY